LYIVPGLFTAFFACVLGSLSAVVYFVVREALRQ
jgi:hypothetical protein